MMNCAKCNIQACRTGKKPPLNYPMNVMSKLLNDALKLYRIARIAAKAEKEGYAVWPE